MAMVTPMRMRIGHGKPDGICRPPGGMAMPFCGGVVVGQALGPVVGVGDGGHADHGQAAEGRQQHLSPDRADREAEPTTLPAVVDEQADDGDAADDGQDPGQRAADRSRRAAAEVLEGLVDARRPPRRSTCSQTTPRRDSSPPSVTMNEGTPM